MKNKVKFTILFLFVIFCSFFFPSHAQKETARSFYQISIYHYKDSTQEHVIDNYLQNALLPSLHRMNIKTVGVFKALSNDTSTDKTMYVLMPVQSLNGIADIATKLNSDAAWTLHSIELWRHCMPSST